MGGVFSDTEYELRVKHAEARMRLRRLDRTIQEQEARLFVARESATGDRADAKLAVVAQRGLERLKEERARAHALLTDIEVALSGHLENEIAHDVRAMEEEIRGNREAVALEVSEEEIARAQEAQAEAVAARLPRVPGDAAASTPEAS